MSTTSPCAMRNVSIVSERVRCCRSHVYAATFTSGTESMLVHCAGTVQMGARRAASTQSFVLVKEFDANTQRAGAKWMIASDRFRTVD